MSATALPFSPAQRSLRPCEAGGPARSAGWPGPRSTGRQLTDSSGWPGVAGHGIAAARVDRVARRPASAPASSTRSTSRAAGRRGPLVRNRNRNRRRQQQGQNRQDRPGAEGWPAPFPLPCGRATRPGPAHSRLLDRHHTRLRGPGRQDVPHAPPPGGHRHGHRPAAGLTTRHRFQVSPDRQPNAASEHPDRAGHFREKRVPPCPQRYDPDMDGMSLSAVRTWRGCPRNSVI
jgi:hypothetical protein